MKKQIVITTPRHVGKHEMHNYRVWVRYNTDDLGKVICVTGKQALLEVLRGASQYEVFDTTSGNNDIMLWLTKNKERIQK